MSPPTAPSPHAAPDRLVGDVLVVPFLHPQGCRGYLVADPTSGDALALDAHLDLVEAMAARVEAEGWRLTHVVDSHTHADHPSGAIELAPRFGAERVAHESAGHRGVTQSVRDAAVLRLGRREFVVRHAPGHTPDHVVLIAEGALFSGDSLFLGAVARTDFLGGDAGTLHDTLHVLLEPLADDVQVFPGHDYAGRTSSTIGDERASNPWLRLGDRDAFVAALTASPPPRPANMDDLLRLNREGLAIPPAITPAELVARIRAGGAGSVIDVRTLEEVVSEHVAGSRFIPMDEIPDRIDEVLAVPAPRLLVCHLGSRAQAVYDYLTRAGVRGLQVVVGGMVGYRRAGGEIESGGIDADGPRSFGCAAAPPSACAAPSLPPTDGCAASHRPPPLHGDAGS